MISKNYGKWNLKNSTKVDDIAYELYLIDFDKKYLKGSPYLDQTSFHMYYMDDGIFYIKAKQKIRIKKIEQLEKNKLSNFFNI